MLMAFGNLLLAAASILCIRRARKWHKKGQKRKAAALAAPAALIPPLSVLLCFAPLSIPNTMDKAAIRALTLTEQEQQALPRALAAPEDGGLEMPFHAAHKYAFYRETSDLSPIANVTREITVFSSDAEADEAFAFCREAFLDGAAVRQAEGGRYCATATQLLREDHDETVWMIGPYLTGAGESRLLLQQGRVLIQLRQQCALTDRGYTDVILHELCGGVSLRDRTYHLLDDDVLLKNGYYRAWRQTDLVPPEEVGAFYATLGDDCGNRRYTGCKAFYTKRVNSPQELAVLCDGLYERIVFTNSPLYQAVDVDGSALLKLYGIPETQRVESCAVSGPDEPFVLRGRRRLDAMVDAAGRASAGGDTQTQRPAGTFLSMSCTLTNGSTFVIAYNPESGLIRLSDNGHQLLQLDESGKEAFQNVIGQRPPA